MTLDTPTADGLPPDPGPLLQPYLLVLFGVPSYVSDTGVRSIDPLWAKDLIEHTRYIEDLTLAAPVSSGPPPAHAVVVADVAALDGVRWLDLPMATRGWDGLRLLPRTARLLWQACGRAAIVHSAVVGWPIPEAWILAPMLRLRRRRHYINVESAPWRLLAGEPAGLKRRLLAHLKERVNRTCVQAADLSTFTQDGYRRSLLQKHADRGHVVEASWIDVGQILDGPQLVATLEARRRVAPLRMLFAGRLTAAKGVRLLLDAVLPLLREGRAIELDVIGAGPLADECAGRVRDAGLEGTIRMRGSVAYDSEFFAMLRGYHVIVVPTLSDEQPRIVFDAYSQGLPVLASDTEGMRQCVEDAVTGVLFRSGDADSLQEAIVAMAGDRQRLLHMAEACLAKARSLTHREMHRKRWRLLAHAFPALLVR